MPLNARFSGVLGGVAAAALTSLFVDRLSKRAPWTRPSSFSSTACSPAADDAGSVPEPARVHLERLDGTHTGPCIAILREQYLNDDGSESGGSTVATEATDYEHMLRSCLEVVLAVAFLHASMLLDGCGCDDPDCPTDDVIESIEPMLKEPLALQFLIRLACGAEAAAEQHLLLHEAGRCECEDPTSSRNLAMAIMARELADDLATNEEDDLVLTEFPAQVAFNLACACLDAVTKFGGPTQAEQVEMMSRSLAAAVGAAGGQATA